MKSGKQRRFEIKEKRRKKASENKGIDVYSSRMKLPKYAIKSNKAELLHNHTYGPLPQFYVDREFKCKDCGCLEIWTAKQQKWWNEIAKGNINSFAIRCRRCRKAINDQKKEQKAHMEEVAQQEPHPNEAFFKKRLNK